MSSIKFIPLVDRVLIEPIKQNEEEKTAGGLYIPDSAKNNIPKGIVKAIGWKVNAEVPQDNPQQLIAVDDVVLFDGSGAMPVSIDNKEYFVVIGGYVIAKV
jgi:chaperonin GroES